MKMLKKLLAVVLTGAMALTLLTACGGNAVTEKDIADAMNDMAKAAEEDITFTPRAKEREMAKAIAALSDEDLKELEEYLKNRSLPEKAEEIRAVRMKKAALSGVERLTPMSSEPADRRLIS